MVKAADIAIQQTSDGISELRASDWEKVIGDILRKMCAEQDRVLLCLTGKTGSGKTTLARTLRRQGLPGFKPRELAVIDDGVMTAPVFGFINRRVRFPCVGQDDLSPFAPYLRRKKVVVYVAINPEERIAKCDVVVRLRCKDEERQQRLVSSRSNGGERYLNSMRKTDDIAVQAARYFDLRTD